MKFFEHYTVGLEETMPETHTLTEDEIIEFGVRWDPQPFHTDRIAAEKSIFGGLVASTVHLFAVATKLGMSQPEEQKPAAVSALGFTNVHLKAPARPDDTLSLNIRVTGSRESKSRPDIGIVEMYHELRNQRDELIFVFDDAFMVQKNPAA